MSSHGECGMPRKTKQPRRVVSQLRRCMPRTADMEKKLVTPVDMQPSMHNSNDASRSDCIVVIVCFLNMEMRVGVVVVVVRVHWVWLRRDLPQ